MQFILILIWFLVFVESKIPISKHAFIVIAHRGNHENAPENTIAAFKNAIKIGVDYVEVDLRTSKDSQLVVMHDATLDRMTDAKGLVSQFTWDTLKKMQVYDKAHPEFGFHSLPLFEEVLAACKGKIYIYLDFKNASVLQTYQLLLKYKMEKQVVVYINSINQLLEWNKLAPHVPLMVSLPGNVQNKASLEKFVSQYNFDILDGNFQQYNTELVKTAIELNKPIWADIQSSNEGSQQWDKATDLGIMALQTDHPSSLIAYLKDKKIR
jgi:glycerophosphoryl diester phosphodiesterase